MSRYGDADTAQLETDFGAGLFRCPFVRSNRFTCLIARTCSPTHSLAYEGASLVLTRFSAWFRLSYRFGERTWLKINAISVFLSSAAASQRFLLEFLEVTPSLR